jgi:hypothetical protein
MAQLSFFNIGFARRRNFGTKMKGENTTLGKFGL